jgi:hypothetical protein
VFFFVFWRTEVAKLNSTNMKILNVQRILVLVATFCCIVAAQETLMGGYHDITDISGNAFVQKAATFAFQQFLAGASSTTAYTFISSNNYRPDHVQHEIVSAKQQLVAGMNYDITVRLITDGEPQPCVGGFRVTVYDHFGDLNVTNWGEELTCDQLLSEQQRQEQLVESTRASQVYDDVSFGSEIASIKILNFCYTQEGDRFACSDTLCTSDEDCSGNYLGCSSSQTCHDKGACCTKVDG